MAQKVRDTHVTPSTYSNSGNERSAHFVPSNDQSMFPPTPNARQNVDEAQDSELTCKVWSLMSDAVQVDPS